MERPFRPQGQQDRGRLQVTKHQIAGDRRAKQKSERTVLPEGRIQNPEWPDLLLTHILERSKRVVHAMSPIGDAPLLRHLALLRGETARPCGVPQQTRRRRGSVQIAHCSHMGTRAKRETWRGAEQSSISITSNTLLRFWMRCFHRESGSKNALGLGSLGVSAPILRWRMQMKDLLLRLWKDESGQDLTEYALLLVLIALAAITAMSGLATAIKTVYNTAATNLATT